MQIKRRHLIAAAGASTLAAPFISSPASAQAKQINLAGASYDMREAILGDLHVRRFAACGASARARRLTFSPRRYFFSILA